MTATLYDHEPDERREAHRTRITKRGKGLIRFGLGTIAAGLAVGFLLPGGDVPTTPGKTATITLAGGTSEDGFIQALTRYEGMDPTVDNVHTVLDEVSGIQEQTTPGLVVHTEYGNEPIVTQAEELQGVPVTDLTPNGNRTVSIGHGGIHHHSSFNISVK